MMVARIMLTSRWEYVLTGVYLKKCNCIPQSVTDRGTGRILFFILYENRRIIIGLQRNQKLGLDRWTGARSLTAVRRTPDGRLWSHLAPRFAN